VERREMAGKKMIVRVLIWTSVDSSRAREKEMIFERARKNREERKKRKGKRRGLKGKDLLKTEREWLAVTSSRKRARPAESKLR